MYKFFLVLLLALQASTSFAVQIKHAKCKSTDRTVSADTADKNTAPFECLECKGELVLRRGTVLAAHFAHKSDPNSKCGGGGPETYEHIRAKELLADHLSQWAFHESCEKCTKGIKINRFNRAETAAIEFQYDRFVVDVMVLRDGVPVAALEVRNTHAVDDNKRAFFAARGIPIIEVDAHRIIEAHKTGSFTAAVLEAGQCHTCVEAEARRNRRPCLDCNTWQDKSLFAMTVATMDKYRTGFVCRDCVAHCDTCHKVMRAQQQPQNDGKCQPCNQEAQAQRRRELERDAQWRQAVIAAQTNHNFQRLYQLIEVPPRNIVDLDALRIEADNMREEYKQRIESEEIARQLAQEEHAKLAEQIRIREEKQMRERARHTQEEHDKIAEIMRVREEKHAIERISAWRRDIQVARETESYQFFLELIAAAPEGIAEIEELQREAFFVQELYRQQEEREHVQTLAIAAERQAMLYPPMPNPPLLAPVVAARTTKRRKMAGDVETNSRKITEFFGFGSRGPQ